MYGILFVLAVLSVIVGVPFALIPIVILAVLVFTVPLIVGKMRHEHAGGTEAGPSGVPTTGEASYDPVAEPRVR